MVFLSPSDLRNRERCRERSRKRWHHAESDTESDVERDVKSVVESDVESGLESNGIMPRAIPRAISTSKCDLVTACITSPEHFTRGISRSTSPFYMAPIFVEFGAPYRRVKRDGV